MDGDKYVIMCGKNYPTCDKRTGEPLASDDGNMTRVPVEAFYSVDFDDTSDESLDVDPAVAAAQRSAEAEARRDAKAQGEGRGGAAQVANAGHAGGGAVRIRSVEVG